MTQKHAPTICDGCGADISTTGNMEDYCLLLSTYSPPPWFSLEPGGRGGALTCMAVRPAIDDDRHFCNSLDCLRAWLAGPDDVAARTKRREEREAKFGYKGTGAVLR